MSEWKEYKLGDLVSEVIDNRGKTPLKLGGDWSESGYRALSAKNVKTGVIINEESIRFVDEELYKKWMKSEIEKGNILITSEAPFGQIYYWNSEEKIVLSQRLFGLKIKANYDPKFIYYQMIDSKFQNEMDKRATGSTVVGLRQPELLACHLNIPIITTQKKIAAVLSSLDDQIETNRAINARLEELASAIFKSWFIDFEPFAEGEFVECEYPRRPKDWDFSPLESLVDKVISGDWGKDEAEGNYVKESYCVRGADFPTVKEGNKGKMPKRYLLEKNFNQKALHDGSIVIEISGGSPTQSTGRVILIDELFINDCENSIVCTNFCRALDVKEEYSPFFYLMWQYLYDQKVMFIYENGSNGLKNLNLTNLLEREYIVIPPKEIVSKFNLIVSPLLRQKQLNGIENSRLASLRDTLLPRLMSGELIPE